MASEGEPDTEIRRLSAPRVLGASVPARGVGESLLGGEGSPRSGRLNRGLVVVVAALLLAVIGYESFLAPKDDDLAWTPPAGLSAKETPGWLQTLCADRTPELCAAANRARNPSDCESLRAVLRSLEGVERKLSARGTVSQKQRWVLVELYGQGHELCQFLRGQQPDDAK